MVNWLVGTLGFSVILPCCPVSIVSSAPSRISRTELCKRQTMGRFHAFRCTSMTTMPMATNAHSVTNHQLPYT